MIGVGITTRNRPEVLACAIKYWLMHSKDMPVRFVVVDDASDLPLPTIPSHWKLIQLKKRSGIAGAKNACLHELRECKHIFLADDDMFPWASGWEWPYILASKTTPYQHFLYLERFGDLQPTGIIHFPFGPIETFSECGGVLLYLTQEVLRTVGGYSMEYGVYGFEHAGYSHRIQRAFNHVLGPFLSLPVPQFWWPIDWRGVPPGESFTFKSSVTRNEAILSSNGNSFIYVKERDAKDFYKPLINP